MERQSDPTGGLYLRKKMERLGVKVLLGKSTAELLGNGSVQGVRFADGEQIDADMVVIAAGIRPNTSLARESGLEVNRGIVVNDFMQTSDPNIYSVGECTEHRGSCYGLVAPLFAQGKVLAAAITGNADAGFEPQSSAAKLKIMGVDVFSAGIVEETDESVEAIKYEDASLGIYKKLVLRDNRLIDIVLVGDVADSGRYVEWLRSNTDLTEKRRSLLFP